MEKEFLHINELVQYLGMKKSNLYSKVERKEIPFYRWGRLIIFKKDEIDAYMERCRVESGPVEKEAKRADRSTRKRKLDVDEIMKRAQSVWNTWDFLSRTFHKLLKLWCRRSESNRHGVEAPRDFESLNQRHVTQRNY
jgi:excisionase family DNA binding protein